jgi:hypothetical protein
MIERAIPASERTTILAHLLKNDRQWERCFLLAGYPPKRRISDAFAKTNPILPSAVSRSVAIAKLNFPNRGLVSIHVF